MTSNANEPARATDCRSHASDILASLLTPVVFANSDTPTMKAWSARVAHSEPVLRSRCQAAGVKAKACLDLARVLRLAFSDPRDRRGGELFDNRDQRTINDLLHKGGLSPSTVDSATPVHVFERQSALGNERVLAALNKALAFTGRLA